MLFSGTFSPRTISLASSVKLQQELEYHIKRLSEIEHEMETVSHTQVTLLRNICFQYSVQRSSCLLHSRDGMILHFV